MSREAFAQDGPFSRRKVWLKESCGSEVALTGNRVVVKP
jgi:hypothetical protein